MGDSMRAEIILGIRACLNSVKGKLEIRELSNDYKQLMGSYIPHGKLGYGSLEEYLRSEPSLYISGSGSQTFVNAKTTEASAHITEMVAKQKPSKKKTRLAPPNKHRNQINYQASAPNKWRPKNVSNKWNTSAANPLRQAAMNHNQVVKIHPFRPPANQVRVSPDFQVKSNNNYNNNNNNNNHIPASKPAFRNSTPEGFTKTRNFRDSSHENENSSVPAANGQKVPHSTQPANRAPPLLQKRAQALFNNESRETKLKTDNGATSEQKFQVTGDGVQDLYSFAQYRKLSEPAFKVVVRQSKPHKPTFYDCQVKIDNSSFSSYPEDFKDEMSAKQFTAKLALDALIHKFGTIKKRESLLLSNEGDVLERIPPLVKKHYHGIWSWQLDADYKDQYNELLPLNWLEVVDMSPTISVEAFGDKYVLRYCSPEDLLQKGKMSSLPLSYEVSIPTSYVEFDDQALLLVEVTCAVSTKEVWCRQIQTREYEAFLAMNTQLENVYKGQRDSLRAKSVTIGNYYVAWIENFWYRVRVLECDENDNVQCLLVDTGDDQKVPKKHMYHLERQFAKQQAQAFICHLAGLEELFEVSIASENLQKLEGKTFQLEPCLEEGENSKYVNPIRVVMYDIETGISINKELISLISIENAQPILNDNSPNEVYISHVEDEGDIYLQIRSKGYDMLQKLIKDLELSISENRSLLPSCDQVSSKNSSGRLYFFKSPEDKNYSRIKILEWSPKGQQFAHIYYVDCGFTRVVKVSESRFYPLSDLSSVVSKFPGQALKVRLDLEKIPGDFVKIFNGLVPRDTGVLLRCVGKEKDSAPRVKLFVRVANAGLVSVTESITIELHNREQSSQKLEKFEKILSLNSEVSKHVPSSGNLKAPPLPALGNYFDVRVPTAVNPWNFFVQPHDSTESLNKLMTKLQVACNTIPYSPLRLEDVTPGKIYASQYEDGKWYRTSVMKVIHHGSISVFYCDFGYYANLRLQQLVPVDPEFLQLPYQAIKAKLSGIKPKQAKWTMDDCKYFQKQVCRKLFVSILTSVEMDELYRCDTVLGLKLVDTSDPKIDTNIEELLVQKNIAVKN